MSKCLLLGFGAIIVHANTEIENYVKIFKQIIRQ